MDYFLMDNFLMDYFLMDNSFNDAKYMGRIFNNKNKNLILKLLLKRQFFFSFFTVDH